jgi:hypothetical protein
MRNKFNIKKLLIMKNQKLILETILLISSINMILLLNNKYFRLFIFNLANCNNI